MSKILSKLKWYSFKAGVINLIHWLPIIWNDRDFDQNYLYRILHKKLEHMESFFRSEHAYTACTDSTANEISEAKIILQRLLSNTYFTDKVEDINTSEIFSIDENNYFITNTEHPDYEKWKSSSELSDKEYESDKQKLFAHICKNIDKWWD
jgi:hypothetical protein